MLWLKWVLGYCVLVGVGLWFGYRSRDALPGRDAASEPSYDSATASPLGDPAPSRRLPSR